MYALPIRPGLKVVEEGTTVTVLPVLLPLKPLEPIDLLTYAV
jgi:hypothetical protein